MMTKFRRSPQAVCWYGLATAFAIFVEIRLFYEVHRFTALKLESINEHILVGDAVWKAFQSRLLGPAAMHLLVQGLHSPESGFFLFGSLTIGLNFGTAAGIAWRLCPNLLSTYVSLLLFVLLYTALTHFWFYPWDAIEVFIFLIFSLFVYERRGMLYVLPLFPLALVNRESAVIFGSWYMIEAVTEWAMRQRNRVDYVKLAGGALLLGITAIYTKLVRDRLFRPVSSGDVDISHQTFGNHFTLLDNLVLLTPQGVLGKMWFLSIAAYLYLYIRDALKRGRAFGVAFGLLQCWVLLQILLFAVVGETRVMYNLLPLIFVSFLDWAWSTGSIQFVAKESHDAGR